MWIVYIDGGLRPAGNRIRNNINIDNVNWNLNLF